MYVIKALGCVIRKEMKRMCSDTTDSVLKSAKKDDLSTFSWEILWKEMFTHAPTFSSMLTECTKTRSNKRNRQAIIGICAAILLKHRFGQMSLVQKILSIILFNGCASKSVSQLDIIQVLILFLCWEVKHAW